MATAGGTEGPAWPAGDRAFWTILAMLVAYVALCTGQRDNYGLTDDWEHHRAIVALSKDIWKPGNPTFATDEPSIRYSPYSLALALIVRAGFTDAYSVLGWAGVANTVMMGLGLRSFLAAYGRRDLAAVALVVMVSLWGTTPAYANSYALADLPIHQVNPSAFAWALTLFMWAWFRKLVDSGVRASALGGITLLCLLATLSHAMTGAAAVIGLGVVALAAPPGRRKTLLASTVPIGLALLAACSAWPWYDFVAALRGNEDSRDYWYNGGILAMMLTIWSAPAIAFSIFALPLRNLELVRVGYLGAIIFYALSISSMVTKSAVTARFPMIGIFFLHLTVAAYLGESAFFRPGSWSRRLSNLIRPDYRQAGQPILDVVTGLALVYGLTPQLWMILRDPGLARVYVAPLLKYDNMQNNLKPRYDRLLAGVGDRDVVLADDVTSWPVPSTSGRIVSAIHLELFTKDQKTRQKDVNMFFASGTPEPDRLAIMRRYNVRWILLSRKKLPPDVHATLLRPVAVVSNDGDLTLMDAKLWEQAR